MVIPYGTRTRYLTQETGHSLGYFVHVSLGSLYKKSVCNKGAADTGNHTCTWPGIEAAGSFRVVPQCRDGTASEGNASPPPIKKNQHR
jgi:hypothetical protein